jgi:hypothetical protein
MVEIGNTKSLLIKYAFLSDEIDFLVDKHCVTFFAKNNIQFQPLEMKEITLAFLTNSNFRPEIELAHDSFICLPQVWLDPALQISNLKISNPQDSSKVILRNEDLFSLVYSHDLFLFPVAQSNLDENYKITNLATNHTFITNLAKVISKLSFGQRLL